MMATERKRERGGRTENVVVVHYMLVLLVYTEGLSWLTHFACLLACLLCPGPPNPKKKKLVGPSHPILSTLDQAANPSMLSAPIFSSSFSLPTRTATTIFFPSHFHFDAEATTASIPPRLFLPLRSSYLQFAPLFQLKEWVVGGWNRPPFFAKPPLALRSHKRKSQRRGPQLDPEPPKKLIPCPFLAVTGTKGSLSL